MSCLSSSGGSAAGVHPSLENSIPADRYQRRAVGEHRSVLG